MEPTRTDVMRAVARLRQAADHLEAADSADEALEAATWAEDGAQQIRVMFA